MNVRFHYLPPGQPMTISRFLGLVASALLLTLALIIGGVFFIVALGLSLVGAAGLYLRVWWLKRKMRRQGQTGAGEEARQRRSRRSANHSGQVIDAEYTVVDKDKP
jgi:Flp pilus assembly protein TadB